MNLVKDTLKLVKQQATIKANKAIELKQVQPQNSEFWQGQYQAFSEMVTMIDQMIGIK